MDSEGDALQLGVQVPDPAALFEGVRAQYIGPFPLLPGISIFFSGLIQPGEKIIPSGVLGPCWKGKEEGMEEKNPHALCRCLKDHPCFQLAYISVENENASLLTPGLRLRPARRNNPGIREKR